MRGLMLTRHHRRPVQRIVMKLIVSGKMCPSADIAQPIAFRVTSARRFAHDEAKSALFARALSLYHIPAIIALTGNAACDSDGDYPLITSLQYWHSRQQSVPYAAYS
ncbi:hypothetical protein ORN12_02640 [Pantoea vagans]|uniref:hypothetical protein n=1 Tax=Pantoea vagans TaxID=470934 RepID=UPI00224F72A0|nr:hypothetical protein [Pantoea vagans]MCX3307909.1 hypothetical protein [Pantoea vagans]